MAYSLMYDECFLDHRSRTSHPECPERLTAIWNRLNADGLVASCNRSSVRPATIDELVLAHDEAFVLETLAELDTGSGYLDPDTFYSHGSKNAALKAAGGTVDAALAVYERQTDFAFALHRPPGHHATTRRAMGFCIFNNIAVAAHALLKNGAERILIFDWDVHHGNGTQDIFYEDPRVFFISVHQWPQYPGSGRTSEIGIKEGRGYTMNFPFPSGASDADYAAVMDRAVRPISEKFNPEIVLVSAGFDAHEKDPLGGMRLTSNGFATMAACIADIAKATGRGPLYVFEGGYHLDAVAESVSKTIQATLGVKPAQIPGAPSSACLKIIDEAVAIRAAAV